jgi:hypothetical protein
MDNNTCTYRLTAQVAVEAIANDPDAYDASIVHAVFYDAVRLGVDAFYLDMLRPFLSE